MRDPDSHARPAEDKTEETPDRSCEQLELLTTVLQEFSTSLDIDTTLQHVTSLVKHNMQAEGVSLFLLDEDEQTIECVVCTSDQDITGTRLPADAGIIGRALREGKTQLVRDAQNDPDFYRGVDANSGAVTRSLLCAPLQLKNSRLGALEVINKHSDTGQFDEHDQNLLTILANTSAMAIHNAQMAEDLLFQERTYRELELAREIQSALLPDNTDAYPVYGVNVPARVVSGDFYDHFQLDDGRICFGLGDVAGKGINAALLMAKTTSLFRCLGKQVASPAALLDLLNTELYANATRGMFVTMVAGLYDPRSQMLTLVNAGHHAPILMHDDGRVTQLTEAGIPLGIEATLSLQEQTLKLADGDLYIYTDGLSECWFEHGQPLGDQGVHDLIGWHRHTAPPQRLPAIIEQATQWKRDFAGYLFDDVTMLMVSPARGAT